MMKTFQKQIFYFVHQLCLDYHNFVLTASSGFFLHFILIKVTSKMRISSNMIYSIVVSSGFRSNFISCCLRLSFLFDCFNIFKLCSSILFLSTYPPFNPIGILKAKLYRSLSFSNKSLLRSI